LDFSGLGYEKVTLSHERGNKLAISIECWNFLEKLSHSYVLKKDFVLLKWLVRKLRVYFTPIPEL
jgi:hypothetical protein